MVNSSIHVSEYATIILHNNRLAGINSEATLHILVFESMILHADHIQHRESGGNFEQNLRRS